MTFDELNNKIKYYYPDYHFDSKKGTLTCRWDGMLEPVVFQAKASDEYDKILTETGLSQIYQEYITYKQEADGTVILSSNPVKEGPYSAIGGVIRKEKSYGTYESSGIAVYYNGTPVKTDFSKVPHYYQGSCALFDRIIGIYEDNLIYQASDAILMMNPKGEAGFIGCYPVMSESGDVNADIEGNNLIVEEYVYYDNNHHHGGWESQKYDLAQVYEEINNETITR